MHGTSVVSGRTGAGCLDPLSSFGFWLGSRDPSWVLESKKWTTPVVDPPVSRLNNATMIPVEESLAFKNLADLPEGGAESPTNSAKAGSVGRAAVCLLCLLDAVLLVTELCFCSGAWTCIVT